MAQAFGIVDILMSGKSSEHRLPQQAHHRMATILPGASIGKYITSHRANAEGIVEFTVSQQSCIGSYPLTMELKLKVAVEIEPQSVIIRFTHWARHGGLVLFRLNY